MKNKEKFHDEIFRIACQGKSLAVDRETNKLVTCPGIECDRCLFNEDNLNNSCIYLCKEWCEAEYEEAVNIDWNKVEVDTPILVRNCTTDEWIRRYFAKYQNGKVYAWRYGKTSWSAEDNYSTQWECAILAEDESNDVCECKLFKGHKFLHKTSCGNTFDMGYGFKYCPFCGKKIKVVE